MGTQKSGESSKTAKTISHFMTVVPHAIEPHESLAVAGQRMVQFHVRHLPVRAAGRIVGLLAERDLELVLGAGAVEPARTAVEKIMTPDPYCVLPDAPLADVASAMAERKIGSALVIDAHGKLLGIFTDTDALKALASLA